MRSLSTPSSVTIQLAELNHDSWMVGNLVTDAFFGGSKCNF
jgi:hypothetical protein